MITIDFALSHSFIRIVKRTLVTSQSQNYVQARFDVRSDDWTAPITAIFKADNDNNAYSILLDKDNTCIIPWEVLRNAGTVNVSAFCGDRHTANIAQFTVVQSGYTEGEMPSEPTPTVYEQILKNFEGKQDKLIAGDGIKINGNVISAADAKSAYVIALEHGFIGSEDEWLASLKGKQGEKGEQGIQGIQGEKGQNGKDGTNGTNGIDGTNGKDGIGITNAEINISGELILTYSNGTSANLGKVVGADGKDGADLSNEVNGLRANKANLVNSSNIFDFDAWAKGLQSLTIPVYRGTLDELNFAEKSITITPTPTSNDTFTMGWYAPFPETMKISVKPNTKYWICWLTNNNNSNAFVFLNGNSTNNVRITRGKGTFVTNNDTSFITLRFGTYHNSAFKVSEIMITEKESIYLPNKVAEGVPEVANEVLAFEKTTQASLDSKYDSSNVELGTATLTPYSTVADKIKSATCLYEKIGDIVIVNVAVIMNATSLGGTSAIALLNMPFSNKSDVIVHDIGISKNGGMFRGSVNKSAWLQFTPLNKQAYNFVADEQVNFSLIYKI